MTDDEINHLAAEAFRRLDRSLLVGGLTYLGLLFGLSAIILLVAAIA